MYVSFKVNLGQGTAVSRKNKTNGARGIPTIFTSKWIFQILFHRYALGDKTIVTAIGNRHIVNNNKKVVKYSIVSLE